MSKVAELKVAEVVDVAEIDEGLNVAEIGHRLNVEEVGQKGCKCSCCPQKCNKGKFLSADD